MNIKKAVEISEAKISYVSLVDKPANKRRFLIAKADCGEAELYKFGKIIKVDENSHFLTGIVYEPYAEDAHGNYMTEEEIRKAAHWFAKNGDKVDIQHSFNQAEGICVVENYVAPCEMDIENEVIAKGTWLMTVEIANDEVWNQVQKGAISGFSMAGVGKYAKSSLSKTELENAKNLGETKKDKEKNILKRLTQLLKTNESLASGEKEETGKNAADEEGQVNEDLTYDEVEKIVDEKIEKALKELRSARGIYKNLNKDKLALDVKKADEHFLKGII